MKFKRSNSSQVFELKNPKFGNFMCLCLQETITTTIRHTEMAQAITYLFEAKITSRGYHIYKNTT